jgi:hypothetical protein
MGVECSKYRVCRHLEHTTPTLPLPLQGGGDTRCIFAVQRNRIAAKVNDF